MYKKAQGVSITVVIVAAIALLVLVVLAAIFIGRLGTTRQSIESCASYGGQCNDIDDGCTRPPFTTPAPSAYKCLTLDGEINEDQVCCLRV